jgi:AraC family transcriptional regulator
VSLTTSPLTQEDWTSLLALAREQAATLVVQDLADHAAYSPFHFTRLFTARVGMSPGQYLVAQRIDAAKRLLLEADDPVIDVATHVGFDSLSSFGRRFHATVGTSPGAFRELEHREIATLVTYLSSPLSSAIDGAALRADGGVLTTLT